MIRFRQLCLLLCCVAAHAQQAPDTFRWVDFHNPKDQDVISWVRGSLDASKWTAIREIGVQYDAALVVTTQRATPQSLPTDDTFTLWSASLTNHLIAPILSGVNLRMIDWMLLYEGHPRELAALYEDCRDCAATTFFTALHYDIPTHSWAARWMRGTQAAPVWSSHVLDGVTLTQVYAVMADPNGREFLATWSYFDHGQQRPAEDFVFRYDLDPFSELERTRLLSDKERDAMKLRLCSAQGVLPELARGQDAPLCQELIHPRAERRPVTTPPANNRGKSVPGASHP